MTTEPKAFIDELKIYEQVSVPLNKWNDLLYAWAQNPNYPIKDMLYDLNAILLIAEDICLRMPYESKLMRSEKENEQFKASYLYFTGFGINMLKYVGRLEKADFTDNDSVRERFLQDEDSLLKKMQYVSRFLRVLKHRGSIEKAMEKKFPHNEWQWGRELWGFGFYPMIRWVQFYQPLWKISDGRGFIWKRFGGGINKDLPELLEMGELQMPGIYGDRENRAKIVRDSFAYLSRYMVG